MEVSRAHVISLMQRVGVQPDEIARALASLPDPVDPDRDSDLLASFGLSRKRLVELLGSSP
jgi:hypothetical protein